MYNNTLTIIIVYAVYLYLEDMDSEYTDVYIPFDNCIGPKKLVSITVRSTLISVSITLLLELIPVNN